MSSRSGRRALEAFGDLLTRSVEASDAFVCIAVGSDGTVAYANPAAGEQLGLPPRELVGRPFAELVEPRAREEVAALLAAGADVDHAYVPLVDAGGDAVPVECRILLEGGRLLLLGEPRRARYSGRERQLLALNDKLVVQAREGFRRAHRLERTVHELEVALEASTEKLRSSFRRSIRAREEERKRMTRDLHDGAQQQLLAVGLGLDLAAESVAEPALRTRLLGLRSQLDHALAALRDFGRGLYPAALADHGIVEGIRAATQGSVPPVELRAQALERYPAEIEGAVYFSCIEAVQNAVKHAQASVIVVDIDEVDGAITFSVRDDGRGFDPRGVRAGAGLRNIADRVRAAGGSLRVSSTIGGGTTLLGTVPLGGFDPGP